MQVDEIGIFHCPEEYPYDAARQGSVSNNNSGCVELHPGHNFEQALSDLDGFSHVWLIFHFHKNENWKPMVLPPRGDRKVGVFASRAPYRPNAIGMSCVRLGSIQGRKIEVFDHDLLDGTPILDIKPYLVYADSVPDATAGWLDENAEDIWSVDFSAVANRQVAWLEAQGVDCLRAFLLQQLAHEPTNGRKKRVRLLQENSWEIAYRTWRAQFTIDENLQRIDIEELYSGYTRLDLDDESDPYEDKTVHVEFQQTFKRRIISANHPAPNDDPHFQSLPQGMLD